MEDEDLSEQHKTIKEAIYNLDLKVKRLLHACKSGTPAPETHTHEGKVSIKLPKIIVPTFANWNVFWQQYNVAIHSKAQLNESKNRHT